MGSLIGQRVVDVTRILGVKQAACLHPRRQAILLSGGGTESGRLWSNGACVVRSLIQRLDLLSQLSKVRSVYARPTSSQLGVSSAKRETAEAVRGYSSEANGETFDSAPSRSRTWSYIKFKLEAIGICKKKVFVVVICSLF